MPQNYLSKERYYWLKVLLDGIFLASSFLATYWLRRGDLVIDENFQKFLPILFLTWFLVTILSKKFKILEKQDYFSRLQPYWLAAIFFVLLLTLLLYFQGWVNLSRVIVFGTISIYLILECLYLALHFLWLRKRESGRRIPFAVFFFLIELLSILTAFFLIYFAKRGTFFLEEKYQIALMGLFFTWLLVSLLMHRFQVRSMGSAIQALIPFWQSEALILGLVSFIVFVAARGTMSRLIVFGSIFVFSFLENLVVLIRFGCVHFMYCREDELFADENRISNWQMPLAGEAEEISPERYRFPDFVSGPSCLRDKLQKLYLRKFEEIYQFIEKYVDLDRFDLMSSYFLYSRGIINIEIIEDDSLTFFFNLEKVNNFRYINQVFIDINRTLKQGGICIGAFEALEQRKERIFAKFPYWFARIFYLLDFFYKRIMPKIPLLKKVYFLLSRGRKRALSKTELLGRLYYCGFDVIGLRSIAGIYYFIAKKTREPRSDPRPSYGPIFRQRRLGQGGKIIYIYKLRTMHPFAEYIHQYIFEKHQLEESGKIKGDFRITSWGRFFRKTWLDELPMLVNWLKRDIKLVGVRPLSETFFKTYPEALQKERSLFKPGLIPPFYADMPSGIEEVWESERKYLNRYKKHPVLTDITYFFKAFNNILFHHAKSS
ncbi:MAG: sugar transferase [Candidatus Aminicenantes bacterium]|nr:sugar transferase [Candidatus Aminicenantes bacterium]